FGSGVLIYLNRNADNFLIGRFLGAARLGAYSLAYSIMLQPQQLLLVPIQNVLFPAMSRLREPRRVGDAWLRSARLLALLTVPSYLGLTVVAPYLVAVVFGRRWHEAIPVLQILSYVGLVQGWTPGIGAALLALNRASTVFRLTLISSTLTLLSFGVGLHWGI